MYFSRVPAPDTQTLDKRSTKTSTKIKVQKCLTSTVICTIIIL